MKIVAIGIHPDDVELGCGATVALATRAGHEVVIVDLSPGSSSTNGTPEERSREAERAASILGVGERVGLQLPDTAIKSDDQGQLRTVVDVLRRTRPEVILVPNKVDPHPDHIAGGELVMKAIYLAGVGGYGGGEPWRPGTVLVYMGREEFSPHVIFDVSSTHSLKMEAIRAHRSQFLREKGRKPTPLNSPGFLDLIEARARVYGWKVGAAFGEPFLLDSTLRFDDFDCLPAGDRR